jgi:glycosyltransferase involved in cell wall biosynthesis
LRRAYRAASILILPTMCDGFGMVVSEALAHGLPVITTRNAGAADLVTDGASGYILPAGDVQGLARTLQWCLDHPRELARMRVAAWHAATRWTWHHFRRELSAHMRRVFGEHPASQPAPVAVRAIGGGA